MDSLAHASDHSVRAILTALCDDPRVRAKALRYLEALEPEAESRAKVAATSQPNLKKRKPTSTLSICVQCGDTFWKTAMNSANTTLVSASVIVLRLLQQHPLI